MKIYKKQVKKHEEVWADEVPEHGEGCVRVCIGNSNYGRFYVAERPIPQDDVAWGYWLSDEETAEARKLFKEIWEKNKDNNPFGE